MVLNNPKLSTIEGDPLTVTRSPMKDSVSATEENANVHLDASSEKRKVVEKRDQPPSEQPSEANTPKSTGDKSSVPSKKISSSKKPTSSKVSQKKADKNKEKDKVDKNKPDKPPMPPRDGALQKSLADKLQAHDAKAQLATGSKASKKSYVSDVSSAKPATPKVIQVDLSEKFKRLSSPKKQKKGDQIEEDLSMSSTISTVSKSISSNRFSFPRQLSESKHDDILEHENEKILEGKEQKETTPKNQIDLAKEEQKDVPSETDVSQKGDEHKRQGPEEETSIKQDKQTTFPDSETSGSSGSMSGSNLEKSSVATSTLASRETCTRQILSNVSTFFSSNVNEITKIDDEESVAKDNQSTSPIVISGTSLQKSPTETSTPNSNQGSPMPLFSQLSGFFGMKTNEVTPLTGDEIEAVKDQSESHDEPKYLGALDVVGDFSMDLCQTWSIMLNSKENEIPLIDNVPAATQDKNANSQDQLPVTLEDNKTSSSELKPLDPEEGYAVDVLSKMTACMCPNENHRVSNVGKDGRDGDHSVDFPSSGMADSNMEKIDHEVDSSIDPLFDITSSICNTERHSNMNKTDFEACSSVDAMSRPVCDTEQKPGSNLEKAELATAVQDKDTTFQNESDGNSEEAIGTEIKKDSALKLKLFDSMADSASDFWFRMIGAQISNRGRENQVAVEPSDLTLGFRAETKNLEDGPEKNFKAINTKNLDDPESKNVEAPSGKVESTQKNLLAHHNKEVSDTNIVIADATTDKKKRVPKAKSTAFSPRVSSLIKKKKEKPPRQLKKSVSYSEFDEIINIEEGPEDSMLSVEEGPTLDFLRNFQGTQAECQGKIEHHARARDIYEAFESLKQATRETVKQSVGVCAGCTFWAMGKDGQCAYCRQRVVYGEPRSEYHDGKEMIFYHETCDQLRKMQIAQMQREILEKQTQDHEKKEKKKKPAAKTAVPEKKRRGLFGKIFRKKR